MLILNSFITIVVPFIFGLFLLSLFLQNRATYFTLWEKFALAFPLGFGILTILMFILDRAKIPVTLISIVSSIIIIEILTGLYLLKKKTFCFDFSEVKKSFDIKALKLGGLERLLLALISLKIIYVFFITLVKPLVDVDAFQYYSIIGKGLFYYKTFLTPYLLGFMYDKPVLPFLAQGWAFISLQTIDDALFKITNPVLFASLLVVFFSTLKRYHLRKFALLFTFLLSTFPFLVFHVGTAYADVTVTTLYTIGSIYLFLFMKEFSAKNKEKAFAFLIAASPFLALTIWAKTAGMILVGINIFVLFLYIALNFKSFEKTDWPSFFSPALIFFLTILPWLTYGKLAIFGMFSSVLGLNSANTPEAAVETAKQMPSFSSRLGTVISITSRKIFLYADWHLLGLLFLTSLTLFFKRAFSKPNIFLLGIITLVSGAIILQFTANETFRWLLDGTLFDRLFMVITPLTLFFCAEAILPEVEKTS